MEMDGIIGAGTGTGTGIGRGTGSGAGPTQYRMSGEPGFPFPSPIPNQASNLGPDNHDPNVAVSSPTIPEDILPRHATLRDRQTSATIVPLASRHHIPTSLIVYLCDQLNKEIEGGDTYPMTETFTPDAFADYWFQSFAAVMLVSDIDGANDLLSQDRDWAKACLGSFYIKANYPGRSSHICNAGFLVTDASRNRGVGRLMGEAYLDWAPRLGYAYSVFNLVYETNVASCRLWDALGFKRIGRVKACGNLRSHPGRLIDAIIYGRDLPPPGEGGEGADGELVSEERFDKIRFYLKYGRYPNGADRAEKSRLRSAATHYKLLEGDKLMLKDKEVIADPGRQYEIATTVHVAQHGGINKTTATIAEKYHWSRIKETVSDVIRNCSECKELGKTPNPGGTRKGNGNNNNNSNGVLGTGVSRTKTATSTTTASLEDGFAAFEGNHHHHTIDMVGASKVLELQNHCMLPPATMTTAPAPAAYANPHDISPLRLAHNTDHDHDHHHRHHPHANHNPMLQDPSHHTPPLYQPIDPQITTDRGTNSGRNATIILNPNTSTATTRPAAATASGREDLDSPFDMYHTDHADFQALLESTEDDEDNMAAMVAAATTVEPDGGQHDDGQISVDHDLDMLIDHEGGGGGGGSGQRGDGDIESRRAGNDDNDRGHDDDADMGEGLRRVSGAIPDEI